MRSLLLVPFLVLAPACVLARASENKPLVEGALRSLRPGSTTAREAVELLGAPADIVQLGKRSAYPYRFTSTKTAGLTLAVVNFYNDDSRSDRAWLFFDENQVLTHMGVTLEGDQTEYAMPWEDIHD